LGHLRLATAIASQATLNMSRQVEQALYSLMPAHGSDLPQSLVELTESLLSQSRLKASTLKAEEDVARLYACAHLACDRYFYPHDTNLLGID
jgi:origin recognition complex subunit 6